MKMAWFLLVFFTITAALSVASSIASPRLGQQPEGICTRDFNLWGHASRCSCGDGSVYDERSGLCLSGDKTAERFVQGTVSSGMAAIGGETTGFLLETAEHETYELILTIEDQEKLRELSGMWFEISGETIVIQSVEMGARQAIIVETIAVLE